MDKFRAEKIVNECGAAFANHRFFRPLSALPVSKEETKKAFLLYIEEIFKDFGDMPDSTIDSLAFCYSRLDCFIEDSEASKLNAFLTPPPKPEDFEDGIKGPPLREAWSKFHSASVNGAYREEIESHVNECRTKYGLR